MNALRKLLILAAGVTSLLAVTAGVAQHVQIGVAGALGLLASVICWKQLASGDAVATESAGAGALVVRHSSNHGAERPLGFSAALWRPLAVLTLASVFSAWVCIRLLSHADYVETSPGTGYFALVTSCWLLGWLLVEWLADVRTLNRIANRLLGLVIPVLFGAALLLLWEVFTRSLHVPQVLLPSPSAIGHRFMNSLPTLWADFQQTFLKAVLIGYALGCLAGFVVAILIDRSPFLQQGLLPVGNLVSALPIVGIAPIMVMWFGFDWPSKAAVVIIMTFFPMLVNTITGLAAANAMQLDLMKTYAASYWQNLFKLRLPEAMPFIFNALKINSTLALIGAIVAEFFGTPIVGMGFRISTEVGRMNVDMVWAEIAVAALAGSCFYALLSLLERWVTYWHPSMRAA